MWYVQNVHVGVVWLEKYRIASTSGSKIVSQGKQHASDHISGVQRIMFLINHSVKETPTNDIWSLAVWRSHLIPNVIVMTAMASNMKEDSCTANIFDLTYTPLHIIKLVKWIPTRVWKDGHGIFKRMIILMKLHLHVVAPYFIIV